MKKRVALLLSAMLLVTGVLSGCGNTGDKVATKENATEKTETTVDEGTMKTGLALSTSVAKSTDAGEEEGLAQADITMAAVTVDAEGTIVACKIDSAQVKINFSKEGKITTDLAAEYQTKQELGEEYGMKAVSSIGKEWNEQADAFAEYCVGKTADEVAGVAVTDAGVVEDLASSCTMYSGGFQAIVVKAVENAVASDAQADDTLGLGVVTNIAKSTDASAEEEGLAQAYTTVSAVTVDADGKITSSAIDAVQANVNFDATGKITSDLEAECLSKNELGDDYGMRVASSIGKEWNEQAAAFAAYCVGKTADEVNGTAVTEGVPSDADLAASVTMHIADLTAVITKAVNNAK